MLLVPNRISPSIAWAGAASAIMATVIVIRIFMGIPAGGSAVPFTRRQDAMGPRIWVEWGWQGCGPLDRKGGQQAGRRPRNGYGAQYRNLHQQGLAARQQRRRLDPVQGARPSPDRGARPRAVGGDRPARPGRDLRSLWRGRALRQLLQSRRLRHRGRVRPEPRRDRQAGAGPAGAAGDRARGYRLPYGTGVRVRCRQADRAHPSSRARRRRGGELRRVPPARRHADQCARLSRSAQLRHQLRFPERKR